jgi:hypothetical protein
VERTRRKRRVVNVRRAGPPFTRTSDSESSYRGINRLMRSRVLVSIFLVVAGGVAMFKGGFLMFVPVDSGGGFVGEGMFYAGALRFIGASVLAVALRVRSGLASGLACRELCGAFGGHRPGAQGNVQACS